LPPTSDGAVPTEERLPLSPGNDPVIPPACEERLGCDATSACLNQHCQRLWSGDGCEPAAETRPVCTTNADCDPSFVCHVDGTCMVGDLYRPLQLKVDASRVYWRHGASGEIGLGWADRSDGGNRGDLALDGNAVEMEWLLDREHIYVLSVRAADRDNLLRVAKGMTTLEDLSGEELRLGNGMGLDRDYVYFNGGQRWSLADSMVLEPTPVSSFVTHPSFVDHEHVFYVSGGGAATHFVSYIGKDDGRQITLAEFTTEDETHLYWVKAYRGYVYFSYGRPLDGNDRRRPMDSVVMRAPVTPGETEPVAYLADGSHLVDVSDQGLFSIQGQRLVRQVIEDYAAGPSPAQGASAAPCFGDQTCDAGLSCLDALCE